MCEFGLMNINPHETSLRKQRILLVRDEKDPKFILRKILEIHGFQVITANRKAALGLVNSAFDLVITDLSLSNNGGIEFIQAIQRINPELKCVVMTSHSDEIFPSGKQLLVNPFSNIQLVDSIRRTLALSQMQATEEKEQLSFDENTMSMLQIFSYTNEIRGYA